MGNVIIIWKMMIKQKRYAEKYKRTCCKDVLLAGRDEASAQKAVEKQ